MESIVQMIFAVTATCLILWITAMLVEMKRVKRVDIDEVDENGKHTSKQSSTEERI